VTEVSGGKRERRLTAGFGKRDERKEGWTARSDVGK
jgi:hypothetical protein